MKQQTGDDVINIITAPNSADRLKYTLSLVDRWLDASGRNITQYRLFIERRDDNNARLCQFKFCIYPSTLELGNLYNLDPISGHNYDQLQSPRWLNYGTRTSLIAGFTVIDHIYAPTFATADYRSCQ